MAETNLDSQITDLKYDYYGRRIAVGLQDGSARILEQDFSVSSVLSSHQGPVLCLSWSHPKYSSLLATGGSDHRVIIWKEHSPNRWHTIFECTSHSAPISSVSFAPYQLGLLLLVGSLDGCISLLHIEAEDKWICKTVFAHHNGVHSVIWRPVLEGLTWEETNYVSFASSGADCSVRVWRIENEEFESEILEGHKSTVKGVYWGRKILSGSEDGGLLVWDIKNGRWCSKEITNFKIGICSIESNYSEAAVLIPLADGSLKVLREEKDSWKIEDSAAVDT